MTQVVIPYRPRKLQLEIHNSLKRFNIIVCHRRFGKTVLAINELIKKSLEEGAPHRRYAYFAPQRKQAKTIAWDYVKRFTKCIPGMYYNESELRCDFPNGSRIYIDGVDNPNYLRGSYLDGAVLDEYSQMPPLAWEEVIAPMTVDRSGFIIFTGTPKGHNHFYKMFKKMSADTTGTWFTKIFRASETGVIPQSEIEILKRSIEPDAYEQEFECSFEAAIAGAYYGSLLTEAQNSGRIGYFGIKPEKKVHTAWDLGVNDSTAIWFFQVNGHTLNIIDFYENNNQGMPHYIQVLERKGYSYGNHYAPHDIAVREWTSGRSRIDTARQLGLKFKIAPNVSLADGHNAVRMTLPVCFFDEKKCERGLDALKLYRKAYNEKMSVFSDNPVEDWTVHAADAFRYLCLSYREEYGLQTPRFDRTLDQLLESAERKSDADAW